MAGQPAKGNKPAEGSTGGNASPNRPGPGASDTPGAGNAPVFPSGAGVGDTIMPITGKDLDGVEFSLSDYEGKVIMIDFWGDW